ncbi:cytochrome b/b6 domain-containing protein [Microbacterium sp. gxy059]|uniref:cytochrome b/b6 domain-containing protein n=1 Tax=Microbacterium sp. gxy059 TaxID=2957199 RepID=UPI003D96BBA7
MTVSRPTWIQVVGGLLAVAALVLCAWCLVFAVRAIIPTEPMQAFLTRFPGAAPLPASTPTGIPAFVSWTHFLNAFFLVLIVRTGLRVRFEKRAGGLWTSRRVKRRRMSLALWAHIAVDVLWLVNGVVFVVLLFASGHWARIVPTSAEVFPNAVAALVQYVSLDWPTHDSWANYNALQQLMYFAIVFLAAPLAAVTGFRLSAFYPKGARWQRILPFELAKSLHWPTMLFFVAFVVVHVGLVFATGALRNLGHMYAGTTDVSWTGFWIFAGTVVVMVAGWILVSRDTAIARAAKRTGDVRMMKR